MLKLTFEKILWFDKMSSLLYTRRGTQNIFMGSGVLAAGGGLSLPPACVDVKVHGFQSRVCLLVQVSVETGSHVLTMTSAPRARTTVTSTLSAPTHHQGPTRALVMQV